MAAGAADDGRATRGTRRHAGLPALRDPQPRGRGLLPELRRQPAEPPSPATCRRPWPAPRRLPQSRGRTRRPRRAWSGGAAGRRAGHRHRLVAPVCPGHRVALRPRLRRSGGLRHRLLDRLRPDQRPRSQAYFGFAAPAPILVALLLAAGGGWHRPATPGVLQVIGLVVALVWSLGLLILFVVVEVLGGDGGDLLDMLAGLSPAGIIFALASLIVIIGDLDPLRAGLSARDGRSLLSELRHRGRGRCALLPDRVARRWPREGEEELAAEAHLPPAPAWPLPMVEAGPEPSAWRRNPP